MKKKIFFICVILGLYTLLSYYVISSLQNKKESRAEQINIPQIEVKEDLATFPYPSLSSIFAHDHTWTATLAAEKTITLIATGDIIPARSVNYQVVTRNDFTWPYHKTAEIVGNSDITFANLETPLIDGCSVTQEGMIFCGTARNIEGLIYAGIDIVSLANNHAGNYGEEGVKETMQHLIENNIMVTGIDGPVFHKIKGVTFAFLGYNDISSPQPGVMDADEKRIALDINNAKQKADVVIVTYHWGAEYQSQPDERQKYLGRYTIDAGADLVIGNHPHWVQPIELYKGKLITYAHGNYIFDQMWSEETKTGVIGKYIFYGKELIDVSYMPVYIEKYGQASFLTDQRKNKVLQSMEKESMLLQQSVSLQ